MFSHLREALLCEGRGFSITLGYFINRTAGARLPDLLPSPAACICVCVWVCVCEHVETKWQTTRAQGKLTELGKSTCDSGEPKAACCCLSQLPTRGNFEKLFVCGWILKAKGCVFSFFLFFSVSQVKKRPSRLTAPFILYYPAWLLTPGELCSQIDALLLWGCSWNIKLYWNIHMWVHLAESNWCATPQTPNGNVAGPPARAGRHPELWPGQWLWFSRGGYRVRRSWRLLDSGRLTSVSASACSVVN